jgi:hypothetical protein
VLQQGNSCEFGNLFSGAHFGLTRPPTVAVMTPLARRHRRCVEEAMRLGSWSGMMREATLHQSVFGVAAVRGSRRDAGSFDCCLHGCPCRSTVKRKRRYAFQGKQANDEKNPMVL